jgi:hypothetical protein
VTGLWSVHAVLPAALLVPEQIRINHHLTSLQRGNVRSLFWSSARVPAWTEHGIQRRQPVQNRVTCHPRVRSRKSSFIRSHVTTFRFKRYSFCPSLLRPVSTSRYP